MKLNEHHRELLGMRTYLNKFAVQVGYSDRPELVDALKELLDNGYLIKIDTYFKVEVMLMLNVYQLTSTGIDLVNRENIKAINP